MPFIVDPALPVGTITLSDQPLHTINLGSPQMSTYSYNVGDLVRLTATVTDSQGNLTDPTSITFQIRTPASTVSSVTPTKDSIGVYHYDQSATTSGTWSYRVACTGTAQAAREAKFIVHPTDFPTS